ncbi:MAG TPA: SirB2 family protein [Quisquiliibacterium sp.]|nr:SirB2 family protein [Quisquiliibacterium sp.]
MSAYQILKHVHVTSAALSIAGFVLRYLLMLGRSPMLGSRAARVLPHVVDTVLLASALAMAWMIGALPVWLIVKIVALLAYIVVGSIALKRGRTMTLRAVAGLVAIAVFAFIVSVALTKSPLGFFAG